ncbi:hypothetical protein GCM10010269_73830 [Streptomyces humidus]|uniref:Uncharacterized protein n=1 Tax=Streptomyces humidus TaxID=52259 RepID=A0A918L9P2_9ACTN|nr:hypothetical protein GCM10010269_73830 [Streptomyces humidus]
MSKPVFSQDGDGTDDRTGWPAVIRGRRKQYRKGSTSSEASERYPGEGVGCGRAHREVRQWGSEPEQMLDGRRGRLPEGGASRGHRWFAVPAVHRMQQGAPPAWQVIGSEGRAEGFSAIRIARAEVVNPGTAGHRQ